MLPDNKARIIGLKLVDKDGNLYDSYSSSCTCMWGSYYTDSDLPNHISCPSRYHSDELKTASWGVLPSDNFNGELSYVDPKARYYYPIPNGNGLIPSPYFGNDNTFNSEYGIIFDNSLNVLSDYNGLSNTKYLVELNNPTYQAAIAANKYRDNASNLQWYLPAMGELAFIVPRLKAINNALTIVNGVVIETYRDNAYVCYWSSTDRGKTYGWILNPYNGGLNSTTSLTSYLWVRPFAMLDF